MRWTWMKHWNSVTWRQIFSCEFQYPEKYVFVELLAGSSCPTEIRIKSILCEFVLIFQPLVRESKCAAFTHTYTSYFRITHSRSGDRQSRNCDAVGCSCRWWMCKRSSVDCFIILLHFMDLIFAFVNVFIAFPWTIN